MLGRGFCLLFLLVVVGAHASSSSSSSRDDLPQQPYRTGYHFQPPRYWINDPDGPMYYRGVYHLFFQFNPYGPLWGNISWGHSVSNDLVNWLILEPALAPDEWYDAKGCFTGSITVLRGSRPVILYTSQARNSNTQVQNIAFPTNLTDPFLRDWTKWAGNPILSPGNDTKPEEFRDPSTAWMGPDGKWRMVIAGMIKGHAAAILYRSADGFNWTRAHKPLHSSSTIKMWECPDFYPVSSTFHVLKTSYELRDWYVLGKYDPMVDRFVLVTDDFKNISNNRHLRLDHGKFYASKSFHDAAKNRRVLWGWVDEVGDGKSQAIKRGWSGLQSFPRTIRLSDNQKQLVQWPVEEIMKLRGKHVSMQNRVLKSGSLLEVPGVRGSQADAEVWFSLPDPTDVESISPEADPQLLCKQKNDAYTSGTFGPFGLLVLASKDLTEQTAVFFRVFKGPTKLYVIMCSDQTRSSIAEKAGPNDVYGAFLDVDPIKEKISLRTLIDHSIVESFGGHGLACITARVYPKLAIHDDAKLYVFNNGSKRVILSSLNVWNMNKAEIVSMG